MTPAALAELVRSTAFEVLANRGLDTTVLPESVTIERSRGPERGDYATNLALQSAKKLNVPPRELATWFAEALAAAPDVTSADIGGPGFVNVTLSPAARGDIVRDVLACGARYGHTNTLAGWRISLELVSAAPTGPLDLAGLRSAAVGDALGRVLAACGADIARALHVRDTGAHVDRFVASLIAASKGEPAPEDGYAGGYLTDIAAEILRQEPSALSLPPEQRNETVRRVGIGLMLDQISRALHGFGIGIDSRGLESLRAPGANSPGHPAPVALAGGAVRLISAGMVVRMGKHAGTGVAMDDLVEAVGVDAARYALVRAPVGVSLDLDLDLLGGHTHDNPVFRVRYAHARLSSMLRNAADLGIDSPGEDADLTLLTDAGAGELIAVLGELPQIVRAAADHREPHLIARYLEELADTYLQFSDLCQVLPRGDEEWTPLTRARLRLCAACRQVLANGLALLGVTAPERM